ncbi:uncharacterized protein LOC121368047 [Gigantopelta aegis]|uniref:uncharacterized protein LOC121368047 n=1 Tax=Gigantopelta aegis TaxID=1735272 RepID=UPI001B888ADD|nr:uncharacterized protein LOC121368047 [Gigantopelta aegis]XP_041348498.1 uncharacterized protein LOC121368047 [Gigantopelta aegis]
MGRTRTRVSAFKVFMNKTTKNNEFDQIKSGEHKIKDRAIYRRRKKSKFGELSDHVSVLSATPERKTRSSSQGTSTKNTNTELVESISKQLPEAKHKTRHRSVSGEISTKVDLVSENVTDSLPQRDLRKRERKNTTNGGDTENYVEEKLTNKLVKRGKKNRKISTENIKINDDKLKSDLKKTDKRKNRKITRIVSAGDDLQNDCAESVSNMPAKRKHREELVEQTEVIKQNRERKSKTKKRKSATRSSSSMYTSVHEDASTFDDKQTASRKSKRSSENFYDETDVAIIDDAVEMVPEVIDVNLMKSSSAVQIKERKTRVDSKKVSKKFTKSKSTSDINTRVSKMSSSGARLNIPKSVLISKWKTFSEMTDDKGFKCSSPSSPQSFEINDDDTSKQENSPNVNSTFTINKHDRSKDKQIKSKKVKETKTMRNKNKQTSKSVQEYDAASDRSSSEGNDEEERTADVTLDDADVTLDDADVTMDDADVTMDDADITIDDADATADDVQKTHKKPRMLALKTKDCGVLLLLPHPRQICLQGRALIGVVCGSASILQYSITRNLPPCRVFSPSSNSLLTLETSLGVNLSVLKPDIADLSDDSALLDEIDSKTDELYVLLRIDRIHSDSLDYLCDVPPYTNLFSLSIGASKRCNKVLQSVGLAVASPDRINLSVLSLSDGYVRSIDKWVNLIKYSDTPPVVLVCAGKNCGKSTAARMLVNAALNVTSEVCFLECDVGQSELTPSGSICLHRLTEPLLGPPFTHQREPQSMCFFGGATPSDNPSVYVSQLQYVYSSYKKMRSPAPLIVNTMGWIDGLGLCLLMDTIHITMPTLIIQLDSPSSLNSFKPITPEYVVEEPGWCFSQKPASQLNRKTHELIRLKSLSDNMQSVISNWKPVDHRNMSLLVYLSALVKPRKTLNSLTPYTVPWSAVGVHVCHYAVKPSQVFCALNASVVALCHADLAQAHRPNEDSPWFFDEVPVCQCLGLGIVRGIDMELKKIYITTPLSAERLQNVNTILKGNNTIPHNVLLQQKRVDFIPYVDTVLMTQTAGKFRARRIARR